MAKSTTGSIRQSMRRGSDKSRGAFYRWLKKHRRTIKAGFARTDAGWDSVVEAMIADGVRGRGGVIPTCGSVSKVWHRLCRDLAEQAAATKRPNRSRVGGSWSPSARVQSPPKQPRPTAGNAGAAVPSKAVIRPPPAAKGPADVPEHARVALANIRRQLAHVDRHIIQTADED